MMEIVITTVLLHSISYGDDKSFFYFKINFELSQLLYWHRDVIYWIAIWYIIIHIVNLNVNRVISPQLLGQMGTKFSIRKLSPTVIFLNLWPCISMFFYLIWKAGLQIA